MIAALLRLFAGVPTTEEIAEAVLSEAGPHDPNVLRAVFLIGSGGSGKSSIGRAMFSGRGLKFIDQDRHLERIYKESGKPLSDVGDSYRLFKQAQGLARKERDAYADQRLGLVVDTTGWDYDRIAKPVQRLRKLGYDCYLVYVTTTLQTALQRNWDRFQAGGRKVPKHDVIRTHSGAERNFPRYLKLFGKKNVLVIRNDVPLSAEVWKTQVEPKLHRAADRFLSRPLSNPIGRAWLAQVGAKSESVRVVRPARG